MNIIGLDGLSVEEVNRELDRGAKFVYYQYCVSVIFMTFTNPTDIFFVRSDESAFGRGFKYSLLSFFCGWWGFPWGPIYTITTLVSNSSGGKNVTQEVLQSFNEEE